jgi:hypothetical protein
MLQFSNGTDRQLWIAFMYYHPNCPDGGDFGKKGWYHLVSGHSAVVYGGDAADLNRYFCYYAENDQGDHWSGQYVRAVPQHAFDWCEWTGSTDSRDVGFRLLDVGDTDNYTLTLVDYDWTVHPI